WQLERGALLIVGGSGSGRSGALAAIAAGAPAGVTLCPRDPEGAWDTIMARHSARMLGEKPLLIDDLDVLLASLPTEYELALTETILGLLREGQAIAMTARR